MHFHDATDLEDCRVVEASHQNSLPGLVLAVTGAGRDMFWSITSGAALSRSRAICTLAQLVALVVSNVLTRAESVHVSVLAGAGMRAIASYSRLA
jgi:hypothetical protein